MKNMKNKYLYRLLSPLLLSAFLLTACGQQANVPASTETAQTETAQEETTQMQTSQSDGEVLEPATDTSSADTGEEPAATTDESQPSESAQAQPVDLMIFAGQSNMAGNGDADQAPEVPEGHGYEFRAVTDPTTLYPVEDPFGIEENREDGIYDIWSDSGTRRKLGDLVPAFMNAYYDSTGVPVVGASASEGATTIDQWMPGTARYVDLVSRCQAAKDYLNENEAYTLRHVYLVWCQGESDGDANISEDAYYTAMQELMDTLCRDSVVEQCLVIRIGNFGADPKKYDKVMAAQTRLCREDPSVVLISTRFAEMADTGLMRDVYHYTQEGYNLTGAEAGQNAASYAITGRDPMLWDYESGEIYTASSSNPVE